MKTDLELFAEASRDVASSILEDSSMEDKDKALIKLKESSDYDVIHLVIEGKFPTADSDGDLYLSECDTMLSDLESSIISEDVDYEAILEVGWKDVKKTATKAVGVAKAAGGKQIAKHGGRQIAKGVKGGDVKKVGKGASNVLAGLRSWASGAGSRS